MTNVKVMYNPQLIIPERKAPITFVTEEKRITLVPGLNVMESELAETLIQLVEKDLEIKLWIDMGVIAIEGHVPENLPETMNPQNAPPQVTSDAPPLPDIITGTRPMPTDLGVASKVKQTPSK